MKKFIKDYREESSFPMYLTAVDFEYEGESYRARLGNEIVIWKIGNSKVHLHLDFSEEIENALEEFHNSEEYKKGEKNEK